MNLEDIDDRGDTINFRNYLRKNSSLKEAKSGQWYSKLKRITNFDQAKVDAVQVDEINHLSDEE